jgi:PAS domain S-box-containing protein
MPVSRGRSTEIQSHTQHARTKRAGVISGFVLLLIVLAANAFIVRRQLGVQVKDQSQVMHTRQVLFELEKTESILKDAETGQRGYLYTGDPAYLEPYNEAVGEEDAHLTNLAQLTAGNPRQQARISSLRALAKAKLAELAQTVSLQQSGRPNQAKQLVATNSGKAVMDKIRGLIDEMEAEETSLESAQFDAYRNSIERTAISIYLPTLLAIAGLILLAYYILREIALRESHLREIRKKEEWYRVTLTSIGDAVIATDPRGKVTFMNSVAETLTGTALAEDVGKDIFEVFPIFNELTRLPVENPVERVIEAGRVVALANHTVLKRRDGVLVPIEDSAAPIWDDRGALVGVVLVFRDVSTERKSLEILRKTEKLATAARLSASVAHEINNPLEAVVNLVYLAKASPEAAPSVVEALDLAEQELDRVAHITRQTLGFYRESKVPELVDIKSLIESVLRIYSNKLKNKNIVVERSFQECPPVFGVTGELKQVMANLISNAADAVDRGGTIRIETWCPEAPQEKTVHVSITDDGPGIAAEYLDRIFEPFFTTKKDVGTGLGLWVTKEIVERHGGRIEVDARSDGSSGAAFSILLPCEAAVADGSVAASES